MRMSRTRRHDEEGFALATVVTMTMAIFLLIAALLIPLSRDISTTRRFRSAVTDRQLAESVLNELYTMASRAAVLPAMTLPGRVDPGKNVNDAGTFRGWAEFDSAAGRYQRCGIMAGVADGVSGALGDVPSMAGTSCFFYSIQPQGDLITVEITTRSGCNANGLNCVFKRYQQRWKRRSFLDFVIFTDQETLSWTLYPAAGSPGWPVVRNGETHYVDQAWATDHCADRKTQDPTSAYTYVPGNVAAMWGGTFLPGVVTGTDGDTHRRQADPGRSGALKGLWSPWSAPIGGTWTGGVLPDDLRHEDCFDIAYTGGDATSHDIIDGPIKTNDLYLWYCGVPAFKQMVSTNRNPLLPASSTWSDYFRKAELSGCGTLTSGRPTGDPDPDPTVSARPFDQIPKDLGEYWKFASLKLNAAAAPAVPGYATITLTGVNNGATVTDDSGTSSLVLAPRSLVFVNGDLRLSSAAGAKSNGVTFMATGTITITSDLIGPDNLASDIGVIAKKAVIIKKPTRNTRIDASLMAIDEAVYVSEWNLPNGGANYTVKLNGTIIGRYRPVFGTYSVTGVLQTGVIKHVEYPKDHKPNPPYFLNPVNATWERIDLTEIQFGKKAAGSATGLVGLTPAPPLSGSARAVAKTNCGGSSVPGNLGAEPSKVQYGSQFSELLTCLATP
jgi:hypothetical protein